MRSIKIICVFWAIFTFVTCAALTPAWSQDLSCRGGAEKKTPLINKYGNAPKKASGSLNYCTASGNGFQAFLKLNGLKKNTTYTLTLNGKPGKPGNKTLQEKNVENGPNGPEGYWDFEDIPTDSKGNYNNAIQCDLEPGQYEIKFFVKGTPNSLIMLLSDNVNLSVTPKASTTAATITIDTLPQGKVGRTYVIRGRVSNAHMKIYVFVHPMTTDRFWTQPLPMPPNQDGSWQGLSYFGEAEVGCGDFYEILAIAAEESGLFSAGQTIPIREMSQHIDRYPHSDIITVQRICP